jgi:hypothetical protein
LEDSVNKLIPYIAVLWFVSFASLATAGPLYRIEALDVPGSVFDGGLHINDSGTIVLPLNEV